jgi:hypothetical protein
MKATSLGGVVREADSVLRQAETAIAQGEIGDIAALRKWSSLACRRLERQPGYAKQPPRHGAVRRLGQDIARSTVK